MPAYTGTPGTDVFAEEPPTTDHPLLHAKNMIYSPHSAAQTKEAVIRMADMCIRGCLAVLNGEKWQYVANPKVYEHPKWAKLFFSSKKALLPQSFLL